MSKELGFDQVVGNRRAVQRAERPIAPHAGPVDGPGHEFFSAPALPFDEDGERCGRCALDGLAQSAICGVTPISPAIGRSGGPRSPRDRRRHHRRRHGRGHGEERSGASQIVRCSQRPPRRQCADRVAAVPDRRSRFETIVKPMRGNGNTRSHGAGGYAGLDARAVGGHDGQTGVPRGNNRHCRSAKLLSHPRAHLFENARLIIDGLT